MKPLPCPACGAWDGTRSDNAPRKCPGCLHLYNPLLPTHAARLRAEGLERPIPESGMTEPVTKRESVLMALLAECEHDRKMCMGDGFTGDLLSDRIDRFLSAALSAKPEAEENI